MCRSYWYISTTEPSPLPINDQLCYRQYKLRQGERHYSVLGSNRYKAVDAIDLQLGFNGARVRDFCHFFQTQPCTAKARLVSRSSMTVYAVSSVTVPSDSTSCSLTHNGEQGERYRFRP